MGLRMREKERYEKEALEHLVSMEQVSSLKGYFLIYMKLIDVKWVIQKLDTNACFKVENEKIFYCSKKTQGFNP